MQSWLHWAAWSAVVSDLCTASGVVCDVHAGGSQHSPTELVAARCARCAEGA